MKTRITNAKIACLDIDLRKIRMQLGIQILVDDPNQLEEIRKRSVIFLPLLHAVPDEIKHIGKLILPSSVSAKSSPPVQMWFSPRRVSMILRSRSSWRLAPWLFAGVGRKISAV